ncbi:BsuPI-related putative proteinase inhibitor [Halorubrum sp. DTA98]|uniref:BsuPI-related putative proteinase inhibitor n=1 Tax=Halorubrum sp. DTA98 TaxID=3402163 RepID=UPI003AAC7190
MGDVRIRADGGWIEDGPRTDRGRTEDGPATLTFPTGQRAEFTAYTQDADPDGDHRAIVWCYGDKRPFTQALGTETLDLRASTTYEATWSDPPSGEFRTVDELVAADTSDRTSATVVVE